MARNSAGKAELLEQLLHPADSLFDARIDLAVRPFEIRQCDQRRPAVTGADDVHHVQVMLDDDPVEMHVKKIESRRRVPVPTQPWLDVLKLEWFAQVRII